MEEATNDDTGSDSSREKPDRAPAGLRAGLCAANSASCLRSGPEPAARSTRPGATTGPGATAFTWRASCKWQSGTYSKTNVQGFFGLGQEQAHKTETSFEADHPEIFAAEDRGITPIEYVLVGLASCLTAGIAAVAQNRNIQLRSVESQLEGKMDIRGILGMDSDVRNGYDDIKVTFKIDADASKKDIEALVAQSQKRSAVYDIITNPVNVTVEVL